jgi:long-chain fatty acid transport protein
MKTRIKHGAVILSAFGLFALSGAAMATNGYFTHGVGTESKGMAGTGIGSDAAHGPIIAASNPALAVFAEDNWEVGLSAFSPMRDYEVELAGLQGNFGAFSTGTGRYESGSEWFPIPYLAKSWRLGEDKVVSFVFYGRGGMNTDWDDPNATAFFDPDGPGPAPVTEFPGVFGAGEAGVDLSQAFLAVNFAGKAGDSFAWGIGPVFAVQAFEARGVGSFAPFTKTFAECAAAGFQGCDPTPTSLSNNGHEVSTGFGGAAGIWWAMSDAVSAGLAYQSKMSMSELDDYADLFAESGGFDIPASTKFGISFKGDNDVRLNLDIEHTEFSDVASVGNPMLNFLDCPSLGGADFESCLGGKNGAGFGWDDMTTYKLGVEWTPDDMTAYRFGYSYGEQPIQEADVMFNILAPGVMEQHFTFGMTRRNPDGGAWNFMLMIAPRNTVKGPSMFDPTQEIELKMSQIEFEVSYLW